MPFERSLEIARRLDDVLRLIRTGRYSTPMLAETVGVSIPTVSRIVAALRESGHDIQAQRHDGGWRYVLARSPKAANRNLADEAEGPKTPQVISHRR
jgi:biotin operon repressor